MSNSNHTYLLSPPNGHVREYLWFYLKNTKTLNLLLQSNFILILIHILRQAFKKSMSLSNEIALGPIKAMSQRKGFFDIVTLLLEKADTMTI